jgi:arginine N-succinyltransferase
MFTYRPIQEADLADFFTLVGRADHGLTSLPKDRALLEQRVATSLESFARTDLPRSQTGYLFVLVDDQRGGLAGCSGCYGQVGGDVPYFAYRLDTLRIGAQIGMPRDLRVLEVLELPAGPAMVGSLLLDPSARGAGVGRFLSLARFLFMADHRARFEDKVIAELRGWIDAEGGSPFWEAVGRHFFGMALPEADLHTHTAPGFVQHLLPRQTLFVDMLPKAAQDVIGAVHPATLPALDILKDEGFVLTDWLDPFEAGPVLAADVGALRTVQSSRQHRAVLVTDGATMASGGGWMMVSNGGLQDARTVLTAVYEVSDGAGGVDPDAIGLASDVLAALQVGSGELVRVAALPTSRRGSQR